MIGAGTTLAGGSRPPQLAPDPTESSGDLGAALTTAAADGAVQRTCCSSYAGLSRGSSARTTLALEKVGSLPRSAAAARDDDTLAKVGSSAPDVGGPSAAGSVAVVVAGADSATIEPTDAIDVLRLAGVASSTADPNL